MAENSTFYRLAELDGVVLESTFGGNRLKKFYLRKNDEGSATGQPSCGDDAANINGSGTVGEARKNLCNI